MEIIFQLQRIPSKHQYKYIAILYSYLYSRKRLPYRSARAQKLSHSPSFIDKFIDYSTWIINLLLEVLVCNIALYFYSLFVFWLALRARQNTAQLVKIYICNLLAGRSVWWKTVTEVLEMLPEAAGRGHHFQARGHSFSPYAQTVSRQITCLFFFPADEIGFIDYKWVCLRNSSHWIGLRAVC